MWDDEEFEDRLISLEYLNDTILDKDIIWNNIWCHIDYIHQVHYNMPHGATYICEGHDKNGIYNRVIINERYPKNVFLTKISIL